MESSHVASLSQTLRQIVSPRHCIRSPSTLDLDWNNSSSEITFKKRKSLVSCGKVYFLKLTLIFETALSILWGRLWGYCWQVKSVKHIIYEIKLYIYSRSINSLPKLFHNLFCSVYKRVNCRIYSNVCVTEIQGEAQCLHRNIYYVDFRGISIYNGRYWSLKHRVSLEPVA